MKVKQRHAKRNFFFNLFIYLYNTLQYNTLLTILLTYTNTVQFTANYTNNITLTANYIHYVFTVLITDKITILSSHYSHLFFTFNKYYCFTICMYELVL